MTLSGITFGKFAKRLWRVIKAVWLISLIGAVYYSHLAITITEVQAICVNWSWIILATPLLVNNDGRDSSNCSLIDHTSFYQGVLLDMRGNRTYFIIIGTTSTIR